MSNINLEEVSNSGRPMLKRGSYTLVCTKVEKRNSSKGNPMLVFSHEIVAPETVEVTEDGKTFNAKISGLGVTDYIVLQDMGLSRLKSLHKMLGLPMSFDSENPNLKQYEGRAFNAMLKCEAVAMKDENTNEPIIDEESGKPVTTVRYSVDRFLSAQTQHDRQVAF